MIAHAFTVLADVTTVFLGLAVVVTLASAWIEPLIPGSIWLCANLIPLMAVSALVEHLNRSDRYSWTLAMIGALAVAVVVQRARLAAKR
jgi:hypothetical protein